MNFTGQSHLVNLFQTKEERQEKYWLVRSLGGTSYQAARMRDWLLPKIERFYGLQSTAKVVAQPDGSLVVVVPSGYILPK